MWTRKNPVFEGNFIGYSTRKTNKKNNYKDENQLPWNNILTSCVVSKVNREIQDFLVLDFLGTK